MMPPRLDTTAITGLLAAWPVGRLAMVSATSGGPWVTPIVFAPNRGAIWTPIDGKPKTGASLARLANAAADPRAALLLDEYSEDWSRLWWVRIDGTVRVHRVELEPRGIAAEAIAALRKKYSQYRSVPLFSGPPTLLELTIDGVRGWRWNSDATGASARSAGRGSDPPGDHPP